MKISLPNKQIQIHTSDEHEFEQYVVCERINSILLYDDKSNSIIAFDFDTGLELGRILSPNHEKTLIYLDILISANQRWLLWSYFEDYGNAQEEYIHIYSLDAITQKTQPNPGCISSIVGWGVEKWFDENGYLWTAGAVSYTHLTLPTKRIV